MVIITFKDSQHKLVAFFCSTYKTVAEAKRHMEADAYAYSNVHGGMPKWVNPMYEDYLEVKGDDGHACIWQYCQY